MQSVSCGGFPFDKEFPGPEQRPFAVRYDKSYKWNTGQDGLFFTFHYKRLKDRLLPNDVYNDLHLPLSSYEKKYLAIRKAKDQEFDDKYAGEIKNKLLAVAEKKWIPPRISQKNRSFDNPDAALGFKAEKGHTVVQYPYYLTGEKLPAGLETPASFFSSAFFSKYIVAKGHEGYLRDYFISVRWPKNYEFFEAVTGMSELGYHVRERLDANFAEYVLTYYYLKDYKTPQQRRLVAEDLATYYSEVAFRASAEHLYEDMHILSGRERCDYASHAAKRIYNYIIMAFMNPVEFQRTKDEYRDEILWACWINQSNVAFKHMSHAVWTKEEKVKVKKFREQIFAGTIRCVND